jgi:hypothetical protein
MVNTMPVAPPGTVIYTYLANVTKPQGREICMAHPNFDALPKPTFRSVFMGGCLELKRQDEPTRIMGLTVRHAFCDESYSMEPNLGQENAQGGSGPASEQRTAAPSQKELDSAKACGLRVFGRLHMVSQDPNLEWALIIVENPDELLQSHRKLIECDKINLRIMGGVPESSTLTELWQVSLKKECGKFN